MISGFKSALTLIVFFAISHSFISSNVDRINKHPILMKEIVYCTNHVMPMFNVCMMQMIVFVVNLLYLV